MYEPFCAVFSLRYIWQQHHLLQCKLAGVSAWRCSLTLRSTDTSQRRAFASRCACGQVQSRATTWRMSMTWLRRACSRIIARISRAASAPLVSPVAHRVQAVSILLAGTNKRSVCIMLARVSLYREFQRAVKRVYLFNYCLFTVHLFNSFSLFLPFVKKYVWHKTHHRHEFNDNYDDQYILKNVTV